MDKKTEQRVKGLANIGTLMARNPDAVKPVPTAQPQAKVSRDAICQRTIGNLQGITLDQHQGVMRRIVEAAIREGYNAGHAAAFEQNGAVEKLLEQQYEARTKLTLPAAVAGIMEQLGMDELHLELDALSTVFTRQRIEFVVEPSTTDIPVDFVKYTLHALADKEG